MVGTAEAVPLQKTLYQAHGRKSTMDPDRVTTFTFGNGTKEKTKGVAGLPVNIGGREGTLEVNLLDKPAPLLLGIDMLTRNGAVIDCEAETITFRKLDGKARRLVRLSSGHLCLPLADPAE